MRVCTGFYHSRKSRPISNQAAKQTVLVILPWEPEIAALNLALRLSVIPKYDALDVVLLKVITNSLEISRYIWQNANAVLLNHIFFKSVWVCAEMRTDCFVSAFLRRAAGIAITLFSFTRICPRRSAASLPDFSMWASKSSTV